MKNKYNAFLSHNNQDKSIVEEIAQWLEDKANLTVWLDKWNLIPGDPWQEEIEKALDESQCCVVFLGPNGIGPWQNEEMRTAIEERVSKQTIRVVPVLLPGAVRPGQESKLPRFLRRLTWVVFQQNWNEEYALHRLVCGIKGIPPGKDTKKTEADICSYRGLENPIKGQANSPGIKQAIFSSRTY
ncbi:toll/interleukin-1 receptor domain-containing protein [Acidobacteriota bacterium]